ncbi:hypothetical protein FSP39_018612 [Pinctada imbricata]|uniref:Uncharacterized protein n=1 Tax=Pinctada imbricata TaxID=66713 RepID=A0AA88YDJ7_PINIB|nr:hypothetical protein FSP39_018612 [Pinctada imbricata]
MKKFFSFTKKKGPKGGGEPSASGATASVSNPDAGYDLREKDLPKLHKAAWTGDIAKVQQLVRKDPSALDKENRTIKQFIGGGASTCRDFVSNFGQNFEPKKVLINIGTRDVQTPSKGVKEKEFEDLFATVVKTWPHSVIYFLPLINRKDIDNATIHASNKAILRSDRTGKINFTKPFLADENMFYDKVHLNDKIGLPALVKHLKLELEMRQASNRNETVNDSFLRSPKNYKPNQSAERQIQSPQPPWPTYNPPPYPWYPPLQNRHFNAVPWFPPPPPPPPFWGLPWSTPQQNFVKG